MPLGTIAQLWRYPVKALAPETLAHIAVETDGFAGDRSSALIVASTAHPRSGKPFRGKEHARLHTVAAVQAAQALAAASGVQLSVSAGGRYFDAQPISLLFDTWLADVEALVGRELEPQRYRPNIFAHAAPEFIEREAALVGSRIAACDVVLRVVATIGRCVTTTYDPAGGPSDAAVLREVALRRSNVVGVYCTVERTGTLMCGAALTRA